MLTPKNNLFIEIVLIPKASTLQKLQKVYLKLKVFNMVGSSVNQCDFQIYENSQLIFCDQIFNGYGTQLKDMCCQLHRSHIFAESGMSIPTDFKFQ